MMYLKSQILARAGVPNANNNVYTREALAKAVEDFNSVDKGCMVGTIENPIGSRIDLSRASHAIENLMLSDDNMLIADIKILDTPAGNKLAELINQMGPSLFRWGTSQ